MKHKNALSPEGTGLVVVDVQEKFRNAVPDFDAVVTNVGKLVKGFGYLKLPVFVTEQYPKGLGKTVDEVLGAGGEYLVPVEKTCFSCAGAPDFMQRLEKTKIRTAVVCGVETHVCVNQTVHDLLAHGYSVHVVSDAVASRTRENREAALRKMEISGAIPTSVEMCLFELLGDARRDEFRDVQALIK